MENITTQLNITQIDIEDLFGIYTYSIPMNEMDISKLLILYGNNGAGKTTILQMIFNLLSSSDNQGHKTELANIKFKSISIILSNEYIVKAYRKNGLIGEFYLFISKSDQILVDTLPDIHEEQNEFIVLGGNNENDVGNFLELLKDINLSIHYLSDDRKVRSNISMILDENSDKVSISRLPIDMIRNVERGNGNKSYSLNDTFLEVAIDRVEIWFKHQTLVANSIGQDSINLIYIDLIEKLLDDGDEVLADSSELNKKEVMLKSLKELEERNKEFIKYKLSRELNLDKLSSIIQKTPKNKIQRIENTLSPYINSIDKKLNAIEETKNIIDIFITTLNDFYGGKELSFNIEDGLKITSIYNDYEVLSPTMLSSGEKQLLLLFCNTITAREHASIFIIDEPELSLNVKWQRKLVNALLSFADGSSIQFILASHSIELLTQYDENVCDLVNIKEF